MYKGVLKKVILYRIIDTVIRSEAYACISDYNYKGVKKI